ncbi:MAG TPA: MotA/TolQ/ExbB proton channel family protein [Planctomycetota bacterium]|nr:MotA/TolQ/ExbB proton channel family protein [Planctomycetota bacterium]
MDLATLIGVLAGFALMALAILTQGEPLSTFKDVGSVLIVFGGSIAALMVALPLYRVIQSIKVVRKVLFSQKSDPEKLIKDLVSYAEIARRDGILSLENMTSEMDDAFIVRGIQMAVDGTDPEMIEQIMMGELQALTERHKVGKKIFDLLTKYSPAFGMIGTLIGLIIMLQHMEDPSKIGSGMAVALLTTLYGAVAANLVFGPIADKLGVRSQEEILMKEIVIRGVMAIQSGDNPRIVEQKLRTYLPARAGAAEKEEGRRAA